MSYYGRRKPANVRKGEKEERRDKEMNDDVTDEDRNAEGKPDEALCFATAYCRSFLTLTCSYMLLGRHIHGWIDG